MVTPWLVIGGNLFTDSSETKYDNRLSQRGAGLEILSDWADFRANFYDATSSKKKNGENTTVETLTEARTSAKTRIRTLDESSSPYAQDHGIYYDRHIRIISTTTYRTETTHTTTKRLFERFEAGMDGWDAELGFLLPWNGPETRFFGGYYDYDNPWGDDVDGWKARLEVQPGPWLSLDAELYEDGRLHGSDWFVGARVSIPLSRDMTWKDFKEGLFSMRPRRLDERRRGEMVGRDGTVHAAQSPWRENLAKRQVEKRVGVEERSVTRERSEGPTPITLADDKITFVDAAHTGTTDGRAATPYNDLQKAADAARDSGNTTVFVYEPGGRDVREGGKVYVKAGNGGKYVTGVKVHPGLTVTSTVSGGGVTYQTRELPKIAPPVSALIANSTSWGPSAVLLHENTTLERMAVNTVNSMSAVVVEPTGNSTASDHVVIRDSDISASGPLSAGFGVATLVEAGRELGNVTISGSSISGDRWGVYTDIGSSGSGSSTLGNITISDSRISALSPSWQTAGVRTRVYNGSTMGGMEITGAAGNITGSAGWRAIERDCNGTCNGPLTVDGWSTPAGGWWNSPTDMGGGPWTPPSP